MCTVVVVEAEAEVEHEVMVVEAVLMKLIEVETTLLQTIHCQSHSHY